MKQNSKLYLFLILALVMTYNSYSQVRRADKWRAFVGVGINYPQLAGLVDGAYTPPVNFPTVNLGIQHMFKPMFGVRLDYGFNRFASDEGSPEFKVNYSRVNAQLLIDPTRYFGFLEPNFKLILHGGPGYSISKPLGRLVRNEQSYLNFTFGAELHYILSETVSVFLDGSYIYGFTDLDDYDPVLDGLGAFNSGVANVTVGISFSLVNCRSCNL